MDGWTFEERQDFNQGTELDQIKEIEVPQTLGSFSFRQFFIKPQLELGDVGTPLPLKPVI